MCVCVQKAFQKYIKNHKRVLFAQSLLQSLLAKEIGLLNEPVRWALGRSPVAGKPSPLFGLSPGEELSQGRPEGSAGGPRAISETHVLALSGKLLLG